MLPRLKNSAATASQSSLLSGDSFQFDTSLLEKSLESFYPRVHLFVKETAPLEKAPSTKPWTPGRWRGGGSAGSTARVLWRTPGHNEDGTFSLSAESAKRDHTEAERWKCLHGPFVAGNALVLTEDGERVTPRKREKPAYNPYDRWQGLAPSGKWILDRGRPRCVPLERASTANSAMPMLPTVSAVRQSILPKPVNIEQPPDLVFQSEQSYSTYTDTSDETELQSLQGSRCDSRISFAPSQVDLHDAPPMPSMLSSLFESNDTIRKSSKQTARFSIESSSRSMSKRGLSTTRSRSGSRRGSRAGSRRGRRESGVIEDVQEILKPLALEASTEAAKQELWRFSWRGSTASLETPRSSWCLESRQSTFIPGLSRASLVHQGTFGSARTSVAPIHSPKASPRNVRISVKSSPRTSHYDDVQKTQSRKLDKDQRAEIKRLQTEMVSSSEKTFEPEVWDSCGIEGEHLKRQQLAAVLGLSLNFGGKNEDASATKDVSEEATGQRKPSKSRRKTAFAIPRPDEDGE